MISASGQTHCPCRLLPSDGRPYDRVRDRRRHIASICFSAHKNWRRWQRPPPSTNWNEAAAPYANRCHSPGLPLARHGRLRVRHGRAAGRLAPGFFRCSRTEPLRVAWSRRYPAYFFLLSLFNFRVFRPLRLWRSPGSSRKPWCSTLAWVICEAFHTRSNLVSSSRARERRDTKAFAFLAHAERGDGRILSPTCSPVRRPLQDARVAGRPCPAVEGGGPPRRPPTRTRRSRPDRPFGRKDSRLARCSPP